MEIIKQARVTVPVEEENPALFSALVRHNIGQLLDQPPTFSKARQCDGVVEFDGNPPILLSDLDEKFQSDVIRFVTNMEYIAGVKRDTGEDPAIVGPSARREDSRFREVVAILQPQTTRPLSVLCSGVLVSDRTILTAAHCVCDLNLETSQGRRTARVIAGHEADLQKSANHSEDAVRGRFARSLRLDENLPPDLFEPGFCARLRRNDFPRGRDLALVHLADPSDFQPQEVLAQTDLLTSLKRPRIVESEHLFSTALQQLTVVGFGFSRFIEGTKWIKASVAVPIVSRICASAQAQARFRCAKGREMVLLDWQHANDTCRGDSGGPAYVFYKNAFYLAAITSRAAVGGRCGNGGVYTLISVSVRNWIDDNLRQEDESF